MESIAKIRRMYYVEKLGFKTIAKALNLSKNTVKKIIRSDQTSSSYQRVHSAHRVLEPYLEFLKNCLEKDEQEPKKRRRTSKKLFLECQKEGYPGSYDAIHHFVSGWKKRSSKAFGQAFIPLEFSKGEAFQFDWSQEEIILAGKLIAIKVAHIRLCYSRLFLMIAYPNEQLEMVMDAHGKAFVFFEGHCQKGIYDNMKTVTQKILIGKERIFNKRFLQMCSHYLFEPISCTPAAGWEKGQVENQVGTGRDNFFTPIKQVENLEELNLQLEKACLDWAKHSFHPEQKDKTVWETYQEEKIHLTPYRGGFEAYKIETGVVSAYSLVQYATNHYSVNCNYVGRPVEIRVYVNRIQIFYQQEAIGEHARCFGRYQRIYDPWHYIPLLERKPGALRNGAPFKHLQLPLSLQKMKKKLSHYSDGDKQFIHILLEIPKYGLTAIENSCTKTLEQGGCSYSLVVHNLQNLILEENDKLTLNSPPMSDCDCYNQTYLSHSKENYHVL